MRRRIAALALCSLCAFGVLLPAGASAAPQPAWTLTITPMPANFAPGATDEYLLLATNVGGEAAGGTTTIKATLPEPLEPLSTDAANSDPKAAKAPKCTIELPRDVTCTTDEAVAQGRWLRILVKVKVPLAAPEEVVAATASVSGGGAAAPTTATMPTQIGPNALEFGFLPGFAAPLTDEAGGATTEAGGHPYQLTVDLGFPTEEAGDGLTNAGHPRDIYAELPPGLIGNPAATPVLCTEAELTSEEKPGCPKDSQVGTLDLTTLVGGTAIITSQLYNMVPPPGAAASFGTNAGRAGIFIHLLAGVRSDGDYVVKSASRDLLALGSNPIFGAQVQLWGDPSSPAHDRIRGACMFTGEPCEASEDQKTAFLTMPTACPEEAGLFRASADSWEEPFPEFKEREASYESAGLQGTEARVSDCESLKFEPTITSRPTTNVTDSPSGLDFDLHQPQETDKHGRSTAALKDAVITLPPGMVVNASQASGLGACSSAQIGLLTGIGASPVHFSEAPQSCPDASKLGTVEATTPLLVQRNEKHEVQKDPGSGKPLLEALHGNVYLAKPFDNPFKSLIAVYFVIEDPKTGIVAKLAGKAEPDPTTGQLTTRVSENPQLPLEDVAVHLFGGPRGALVSPPVCAPQGTEATLTPWSTPQAKTVSDSFHMAAAPGGGSCPTSEAQMPNAPALAAGTLTPQAGAFSPLLFKLSRQDGSQRLGRIEATLPTGLLAKLAGVAECPESGIAKARSREEPEQGAAEKVDPSCPASSQIGTVNAGAGAGPTPYYTQGHAYLAGPYKGAPLSVVAIAPAVAGPFDLGTVVNRSALYLDPETGQGRIVSDPLPSILHGVPVDLRSVAVRADRPNFTINPTSCNEKSFGGSTTSTLGLAAPLFKRFQVGGCSSLPFKPKLTVSLKGPIHRGGHPSLRAVFTAKGGEANTASISFAFPKSEFIDQAHFRTICTRVQFAANQCPAGSVYGHVVAYTPLLDYPLEGPVYLRSSSHKLPDLVFALRGPAAQPIAFDAVGRVDSVNGGLRVRFETVPDAPLSKVIVTAQGAKKGLFQNSTNICKGTHRATLKLNGQNGKIADSNPALKAKCPKGRKGKGGKPKH